MQLSNSPLRFSGVRLTHLLPFQNQADKTDFRNADEFNIAITDKDYSSDGADTVELNRVTGTIHVETAEELLKTKEVEALDQNNPFAQNLRVELEQMAETNPVPLHSHPKDSVRPITPTMHQNLESLIQKLLQDGKITQLERDGFIWTLNHPDQKWLEAACRNAQTQPARQWTMWTGGIFPEAADKTPQET